MKLSKLITNVRLFRLIAKAERMGACYDALAELQKCRTLEDILAHPEAGNWAVWAWHRRLLPTSLRPAWEAYTATIYSAADVYGRRCASPWMSHGVAAIYTVKAFCDVDNAARRRFAQAVYEAMKG